MEPLLGQSCRDLHGAGVNATLYRPLGFVSRSLAPSARPTHPSISHPVGKNSGCTQCPHAIVFPGHTL